MIFLYLDAAGGDFQADDEKSKLDATFFCCLWGFQLIEDGEIAERIYFDAKITTVIVIIIMFTIIITVEEWIMAKI